MVRSMQSRPQARPLPDPIRVAGISAAIVANAAMFALLMMPPAFDVPVVRGSDNIRIIHIPPPIKPAIVKNEHLQPHPLRGPGRPHARRAGVCERRRDALVSRAGAPGQPAGPSSGEAGSRPRFQGRPPGGSQGRGGGGKPAGRGERAARKVRAEMRQGQDVARAHAAPGVRDVARENDHAPRKVAVRLYTYGGALLLAAARLYQGQTTNMRTPGGGFAPVLVTRGT